jgi:hypothetical protein
MKQPLADELREMGHTLLSAADIIAGHKKPQAHVLHVEPEATTDHPKRRRISAAGRKRIAEAQRARWAKLKRAK